MVMVMLMYGCTAVFFWQPARGRRLAAIVLGLYTLVCGAGLLALVYLPGTFRVPGFLPLLHIYAAVLLLALPIHRFAEGHIRRIIFPAHRPFLFTAYGIAVISLVGNLTYLAGHISDLPTMFKTLSFGDAYKETALASSQKEGLSVANIPIVLAGGVHDMIPFLLLCLLTMRKHLALKWALATCIVLPLFAGLSQGGRNKFVFFGITMCGVSVLFWSMLPEGTRRRFLRVAMAACAIITVIVLLITASRFEAPGSEMTPGESLLIYAGQPMLCFGEYIYTATTTCNGDMNFPLIRAVLGLEYSQTLPIRNHIWETALGVPLGVFYTFLGDWILDFGSVMTAFLVLVVVLTTTALTRRGDGAAPLHQLLVIYMLFITVGQGAFYYQHKAVGGNLQLAAAAFFYLLFRFTTPQQVAATRGRR
jgi:oligosaccharide repeat unit polymerase